MKASPDDFVILVPHPWTHDPLELIEQTHVETWQTPLEASGATFVVDDVEIATLADDPLPDIAGFAATSLEPYGASALAMLEAHVGVWRLIAPTGFDSARAMMKLAGSLVEAGASGAYLPGLRRLHSPRTVRRLTMEIAPPALANFFVTAFDRDDWMRTRGLTPFGLPELVTPIDSGLNAAYFRLMDVSTAMISQRAPFPLAGTIELGPRSVRVAEPSSLLLDEDLPVNGLHGLLALLP